MSWRDQIRQSRIPYPERHRLENEVCFDLEHGEEDIRQLDPSDISDLEEIHRTRMLRLVRRLGVQQQVESLIAFIPLMMAVTLTREGRMIEFIKEGGAGMYVIVTIGIFLLACELRVAFRLILLKDHTKENLRFDTTSVLLGCLALMFIGIGWSALGAYFSFSASIGSSGAQEILLIGLKESLTPTILSALLSGLVILAHYATRRIMDIWHVPVTEMS